MAVLIDSSVLVEWERTDAAAGLESLVADEERAISVVTVSELLQGVHRASGARRMRRLAFVEHILAALEAVAISETVARTHARIWADLEARGEALGAHDLWIAATAVARGFGIVTHDRRAFDRVEGLRVVAP